MKKIACLGPSGTYSHYACQKLFSILNETYDICFFKTINEVFQNINGEIIGIIPIENSLDGYVQMTLDNLLDYNLEIIGDLSLPVKFSFIANCKIEDVQKIYVQFKSKGQCTKFINEHSFVTILTDSNMESKELLNKTTLNFGAIVPYDELNHKYKTYIENVTDSSNNYTRFLIVKGQGVDFKLSLNEEVKASVVACSFIDKPGLLFEMLKVFQTYHLNLISIMSRPTKKEMGTYNFFIDFNLDKAKVNELYQALDEIEKNSLFKVKLLGIYSSVDR